LPKQVNIALDLTVKIYYLLFSGLAVLFDSRLVFDVFVIVVVAALGFAVWSRACARETVVSVTFYLCYASVFSVNFWLLVVFQVLTIENLLFFATVFAGIYRERLRL